MMLLRAIVPATGVAALVLGCSAPPAESASAPSSAGEAAQRMRAAKRGRFTAVGEIFAKNCVKCHSGPNPKEGIDLSTYARVMKGNKEGKIVVPGKPEASLIVKVLRGRPGVPRMPPGKPLPEAQIGAVENWIRAGAKP